MVRPLLSSRLSTAPTRPRRTASGLIRTKERWVGTSTAAVMDETLAAGRPGGGRGGRTDGGRGDDFGIDVDPKVVSGQRQAPRPARRGACPAGTRPATAPRTS